MSKILIAVLVFGFFFLFSAQLVLVSEGGLITVACSINEYQEINNAARERLSPDAIIISDRADKKFWPEFRVVKLMGDWSVFDNITPIVGQVPVYYYSHNQLTEENYNFLNNKMEGAGLEMIEWGSLNGEDRLYELEIK